MRYIATHTYCLDLSEEEIVDGLIRNEYPASRRGRCIAALFEEAELLPDVLEIHDETGARVYREGERIVREGKVSE